MKTFSCTVCSAQLFFENDHCLSCDHALGFVPEDDAMVALEENTPYRRCLNYAQEHVCNWLVDPEDSSDFCRSCRLNRTIPNLGIEGNRQRWYRIEVAKRRLLYTLIRLRLPIEGMSFDFLDPTDQPVLTGHSHGHITLNAQEADDAERERMRAQMNEPYRTLLGHFRHESAHHYWDVLVRDRPENLESCRALFGDERADYGEALQKHYDDPVLDWQERGFISAYASSHPWEDWAETWAHYLHLVDTLQTASAFGLTLPTEDFQQTINQWHRLSYAINSINRSMGISDLYPFVLSPQVIQKLHYLHGLLTAG